MIDLRRLYTIAVFGLVSSLLFVGCELDFASPNAPTEPQALGTSDGIEATTVGMQGYYAEQVLEPKVLTIGTTAREVTVTNTLSNLQQLEQGGTALPATNANVNRLWSRSYRVVRTAERLIENVRTVPFEEGTESGILATAHLFKAMALGTVAQGFEQGALTVDEDKDVEYVGRNEVLAEALNQLAEAERQINQVPPSEEFLQNILAPGIDLPNTISAYQARYNLFAGNYSEAIDAANAVDLEATSLLSFNDQTQNPIWNFIDVLGYYAPRDNFGSELTESGDQRLEFYTSPVDTTSDAGDPLPFEDVAGFADGTSTSFPLYVPGEMVLIRAEAKLRLDNFDAQDVVSELDKVRTKTANEDPLGVGADLSAYNGPETEAALEEEILRQRRAELFMQGLALEDLRRLAGPVSNQSDPGDFERTRNFYPYPAQERRNNPNTPEDPGF
jgi:hypothetical protein